MMMRSEEEIAVRELTRAAYHEASHAALIRHFGAYPTPSIWRNVGYEERLESAWRGTCEIANLNLTLNKERFSLIAMAGFIGEQIAITTLDGESLEELEEIIADMLFSAIDVGEFSASDLRHVAEDASGTHVRHAFRLVIDHWNDIELDANNMITQAKTVPATDQRVIYPQTGRPSITEYFEIQMAAREIDDINAFLGIAPNL